MRLLRPRRAEVADCVVHLAGTGDHRFERRMQLGSPLLQKVLGWVQAGLSILTTAVGGNLPALTQLCKLQELATAGNAERAGHTGNCHHSMGAGSSGRAHAARGCGMLCCYYGTTTAVLRAACAMRRCAAPQGIATMALESPYYGRRRPPWQEGSKLCRVSDLLTLGRATIEESLYLLAWSQREGFDRLGAWSQDVRSLLATTPCSLLDQHVIWMAAARSPPPCTDSLYLHG